MTMLTCEQLINLTELNQTLARINDNESPTVLRIRGNELYDDQVRMGAVYYDVDEDYWYGDFDKEYYHGFGMLYAMTHIIKELNKNKIKFREVA